MGFSNITLKDFFNVPKQEEFYQKIEKIGSELYLVTRYFNEHTIDDNYSKGLMSMTAVTYYIGVCPIIQLEHSLLTNAAFNLEYSHAVLLRSYLEIVGRTHKAIRLYRTYLSNKDDNMFREKCERLIKPYKKDGEGENGFGITTLVDSLKGGLGR